MFYSNRSGKYEAWTIRSDGGAPKQISVSEDSLNYPFYDPTHGRIWTWVRPSVVTLPVGAAGPEPPTKTGPIQTEDGAFRAHAITPDGRRLAGIVMSASGSRIGIGWHHLQTRDTWISRESADSGPPAWLDETRMVFAPDARHLATVDTSKRRRIIGGPFPFEIASTMAPAVAPGGRTVFVAAGTTETDVWMAERR